MSKKKVLVAEDSSIMRMYIATSLKRVSEIQVLEAENGAEALKVLKEGGIALVILDVNMPNLNGFEVLRNMRQDPGLEKIPVVLCTKEADARKEGDKLGADAYLTKPVSQVDLNKTVKQFLGIDIK